MGKNLKGKECGKGICQKKDGQYAARYTAKDDSRKESELLSQILEYGDRRTGQTQYLCMRNLVFINSHTEEPAKTVRGKRLFSKRKK